MSREMISQKPSRPEPSQAGQAKLFERCLFVVKKVFLTSPGLVMAVGFFTLISALIPLLTLWVAKQLMDTVVEYLMTEGPAQATFRAALFWLLIEFAVVSLGILLTRSGGYLSLFLSRKVSFQMEQEIYSHCLKLDYSFFEAKEMQDMFERGRQRSAQAVTGMFSTLVNLAGMAVTIVGSLAMLFRFKPWLCVLALVVTIPNFWFNMRLSRERYQVHFRRSERYRRQSLYGMLLTMPWYMKQTILLGAGQYFYDKWKDATATTVKEDLRLEAKQAVIQAGVGWLSRLLSACAYAIVVIGTRAVGGTIGGVTMNVGLFAQAQGQTQGVSNAVAGLHRNALFLQDYFQLIGAEPGIEGRDDGIDLAEAVRSIDVRNVSFTYPDAPEPVLKDISFRIEAGECLFLAGRNGAGKTTLIKLLMRLYDPAEGVILVNDRDIREYTARSLRKAFSLLMQDYSKYPFSARENIVIGDVENLEDEYRMQYALGASKFGEVVPKLPDGLDTYLMRYFGHGGGPGGGRGGRGGSSGTDLSGGEWQKLGLARSFYRDSSVLILDEPTSALDVESETEVLMTFKQEVIDKVAIIVSHRLSAAAIAGRVIFMADGELVEDGRHDQLAEGDGPYGSLYRLQQEGYSFL